MHSWLEYGIGDIMSFLGCHNGCLSVPSWVMLILVTWLRYCPVSPPYSYFIFSLQLISSPWGRTLNMQIPCTSLKFPLILGIHWCFLPDAAFTRWWQNADFPTSALFPCLKVSLQNSIINKILLFSTFICLYAYLFLAWTHGFQFFSALYFITVFN